MVLAAAQIALNQFDARATLAKVTELAPGFSLAAFTGGPIYSTSRTSRRRKYYRAAISSPNDMYYWALGDVYPSSNKLEEARRSLTGAAARSERPDGAYRLGREFIPGPIRRKPARL
jgi:hypothetical protein